MGTRKRKPEPEPTRKLEKLEKIPLRDGGEFEVDEDFFSALDRLYPAVDPVQTLREICGWCIGNPTKRKTARGVKRFIVAWFASEQERHGKTRG